MLLLPPLLLPPLPLLLLLALVLRIMFLLMLLVLSTKTGKHVGKQACLQRFPQTPVDTKRPADLDVVVGSMVCDRKPHLADREDPLRQQK